MAMIPPTLFQITNHTPNTLPPCHINTTVSVTKNENNNNIDGSTLIKA